MTKYGLLVEFDVDKTGTLTPDQVKAMLIWMNGGDDVTSEEVEWVIGQADVSKEGSLRPAEINSASAVWYTRVMESDDSANEPKSCVCTIL